jgi:parallel beta-helix repeat protein
VTDCEISNNVVKNGGNGIYLGNSNNNTIKDNTVESNNIGIYLFSSDSNTIKSNNIQNNNANGIWLTSACNSNTIYLNDFSDNIDSNAKDYGSNNWDYNSQGNYWDDYNDYDSNEDGIGDNPYIIAGGGGNQDNYPLGDFLSLNQQPVAYIDSISPNPATQGQTVNFNGHGSDDGSIVAKEWRSNGAIISTSEDFSKSDFSPGTYTISFRIRDNDGEWSDYDYETLVINAQNQKPVAYILDPIQPITKQYGESIRFLGQGSDDGQIIEYSWRSSIDGDLSDTSQFTINNLTVGQHTIYFKVRDDHGEWSSEAKIAVTIESDPSNNPPVADAGAPYSGHVNQSITFDGSSSYDPDDGDSITSYQWDFGDGSTGEGVSPQHTYTSEGSYTVELTVKDGHGEQSKSTTSVNVQAEGQNGKEDGDKDNGIPGFELVFVITAIIFILLLKRKKRK